MKKQWILSGAALAFTVSINAQTLWNPSGNDIFNTNTGNVGINTNTPANKLEVVGANNLADGIMVTQTGGGVASLFLNHSGGGKNWGLFSTLNGDFGICSDVTPTANNLRLYVGGTTGNIGIGTFSPGSKLGIALSSSSDDGISVGQSGSGAAGLYLYQNAGGKPWSLLSDNSGNFTLKDNSTNANRLFFDATYANIKNGNGNQPYIGLLKLISDNWSCDQESAIEFWNGTNRTNATSKIISKMEGCSTGGEALIFETQTAGQSTTSPKLTIKNNGQVVIGNPLLTASPYLTTALLTVKGQIVSQEVIVTMQNWSDFVFDKNYKLMSLPELETYYKNNHHLPDVPGTKEIVNNGNELGKTDAILLQKIEELTLYIVDLEKRLKEIENK